MIPAKRVDIRYATALLQTAKEQGLEKEIYRDMLELRMLFLTHTDFRLFLQNPAVKPSQKGRILQELFQQSLHKLTLDFLWLIIKKSRVINIQGIVLTYVQLYRKEHRLKTITVYTAQTMSDVQKNTLQTELSRQFPEETVELSCRIRSEMIGGLILRFDDYLYDGSISAQLGNFHRKFESNSYEPQI